MKIIDVLTHEKAVAVVRASGYKEERAEAAAAERARACIEGGINLIEITFSFEGAKKVIKSLSGRTGVYVGAGTVLTITQAGEALDAGAEFLVCPHTDPEIIGFAKKNGLAIASGALTSNEIVNAWNAGADLVKIFPARELGGPRYIRAMKEPLPFIKVMATGGVNLDNLHEYLESGAAVVGLSSCLFGPAGDAAPEEITRRAKRLKEALISIS